MMRHHPVRSLLFALMLSACATTSAWPQQESRPDRGKRVVNEALKALGGDAFLALQDRTETGRIYSFDSGTGKLGGGTYAIVYTQYMIPVAGKYSVRIRQVFGKNQDEGGFLFKPAEVAGLQ